ncbi:MAG TPA: hypothetical protein VLW25_12890, partial [Bryobacteraceae bacterium]|nr:hypothetical protein [Bryobacteraceae bacterium]
MRVLVSFAAAGMLLRAQVTDPPAAEQIRIGEASIEVSFAPGNLELSRPQIRDWITHAADAVAEYFGRFPMAHVRIRVRPVEGRKGVF